MSAGSKEGAAAAAADPRPIFVARSDDSRTVAFRGPLKGFKPKDGARIVQEATDNVFANNTIGKHQFSATGNVAAFHDHEAHELLFFNAATGKQFGKLSPGHKIQVFGLSPLGRYVVTWHRYDAQASDTTDNLLVWDVRSGERVGGFVQKKLVAESWPTVRWRGPDDSLASVLRTNQIVFYDMNAEGMRKPAWKIHAKGVTLFEFSKPVAPGSDKFYVATFSPESRGGTGMARIFDSTNPEQPVVQRAIFNAQDAKLSFSPSGKSLLVQSSSAQDKTGGSYYGNRSGCLLGVDAADAVDVTMPGTTHTMEWSPTADIFISITGSMPNTKIELTDHRGRVIKDLGVEVRH